VFVRLFNVMAFLFWKRICWSVGEKKLENCTCANKRMKRNDQKLSIFGVS
jgi:hypothetical protein